MMSAVETRVLEALLEFKRRFGHPQADSSVLVALSGGADSLALLELLHRHRVQLGLTLQAATVNHGARPFGREVRALAAFCRSRGIPWTLVTLPEGLASRAREAGQSFEAQARAERYAALEQARVALGARYLATAHHLDDQAETVLLRLLRGAGPLGLAGIAPVLEGGLLRPLLFARHGDLQDFAVREDLPICEDPSNQSLVHRRNRLRHELLPALEEAFPGASRVLARQAGLFRGHAQLARRLLGQSLKASLSAGVLAFDRSAGPEGFEEEELLVLLHQALHAAGLGHGLEAAHLGLMLGLAQGEALDLPGGLRAEVFGTRLFVFPGNSRGPASPQAPMLLSACPGSLPTALGPLSCLAWASLPSALDGHHRVVFQRDDLAWPLRLRPANPGEIFQPWGAHAPKPCGELLSEAGIPRGLRSWPLLLEDAAGTQLWLLGCRRSRFLEVPAEAGPLVSLALQPQPLR